MTRFQLRIYQEEAVAAIRSSFGEGHRRSVFVLPTGGGKCLGRGTPILMFDGTIKPVEEVRPGDQLMGPDSRPRNVLSTCTGRESLYRVIPRKGDPYVVNESHVLSLRMTAGNKIGHAADAIVNISVRDYLSQSRTFRHCAKGWRAAVDFPRSGEPLPIPSYMLGVWLGDGARRHFSITTGDPEIGAEVMAFAGDLGMAVRCEANSPGSENLHVVGALGQRANRYGRGGNPLMNELRAMGLTTAKRIQHRYRTGTRSERLELLAGILDTDGHYTGKGFDLCLKDEALFDDVLFVARSLGFAAYKTSVRKTCTNTGASGEYFRCSISGDVDLIPCRIPRKQAAARRQIKNPLRHGIALEPMGEGDYFGFTIDDDHLFMLGDFTVTHNTVVFCYIAEQAAAKGSRALILVHRNELLNQTGRSLDQNGISHGVIKAGRSENHVPMVQVASVQSIARRLQRYARDHFQLVIVDEAHHTNAGEWARVVEHFSGARVLGVTATPCRLDGRGLGEFYSDMILGPTPQELTDAGFLAKARVLTIDLGDTSGIGRRMGDFNMREAGSRFGGPTVVGLAVENYLRHLPDGGTMLSFCCSVEHAEAVAEEYRNHGIAASSIDGTMSDAQREDLLGALGEGSLKVLTSCQLIGEGVDVPSVNGCQMLRPTESVSWYLQMVGRCLRPAPGKDCAIILDHVGNVRQRHGHHLEPRDWTLDGVFKRPKDGPSVRECPRCLSAVPSGVMACPNCGAEMPRKPRPQPVEVEGDLVEVDVATARAVRRREQASAKTLQDLVELGRRRGYRNPEVWARKVHGGRQQGSTRRGRVVPGWQRELVTDWRV